MKKILIKLGAILSTLLIFFRFGKSSGKKAKEKEIIENNEKKKKQYAKNKFNSINDVINELQK